MLKLFYSLSANLLHLLRVLCLYQLYQVISITLFGLKLLRYDSRHPPHYISYTVILNLVQLINFHFIILGEHRLLTLGALDQGDLLLQTLRIFRQHPEVLEQYRSRFKHILVDEFQV